MQVVAFAWAAASTRADAAPDGGAPAKAARTVVITEQARLRTGETPAKAITRVEDGMDVEVELLPSKQRRKLRTCADVLALGEVEVQTVEVIDQRFFNGWTARCRALQMLRDAKPAARSFLDGFTLDAKALDVLPATLRLVVSDDEVAKNVGRTWRAAERDARARTSKPHELTVSTRDDEVVVSELGRGDVDGDGLEDLVVLTSGAATEGTLRESGAFALTRKTPTGPFTIVKHWRGAY